MEASAFTQRRLKFVATINDETLSETTDPDHELTYVDIGNVDSLGRITGTERLRFANAPSRARRIARDGDVIVSTVRTYLQAIAPIIEAPDDLVVSTGFAVVRPLPDLLDAGFCKYAFRDTRFLWEVESRSTGVSYPAINSSALGDIEIALPPLDEQRRIAAWLDAETAHLDALIAEKQRMLALLAERRAARVSRAVTRGLDPGVALRPSGLDWLGDIPAHWAVRRCATLFRDVDERGFPDLPVLNVSLNTGVTLRTFSATRIESVPADFNTYKVARAGTLVFNKMRFWQGAAGIAPVDGLTSPDYTVATMSSDLAGTYVELLMRTRLFNSEVRRYSYGMVDDRLRLYWDGFKNIRIPVPPLAEQHAITGALADDAVADAEIEAAVRASLALLAERRRALVSAAVTGRASVPDLAPA